MNVLEFAIQWHITSNCLNKCKHCYMFDDSYQIENTSFENFKKMLDNIQSFFCKYEIVGPKVIALSGGAPFLNPYFESILDLLISKEIKVNIMDIPESVTDKNLEILKKYGIKNYQVSLDGLENAHDSIRGKGSFLKTINACKKLINQGIHPNIMYTVNELNIDDLMSLVYYIENELSEYTFSFDFMVLEGNGCSLDTSFEQEKIKKTIWEYYEYAQKVNAKGGKKKLGLKPSIFNILGFYFSGEKIHTLLNYSMCSGCYNGWSSIAILPNGDVLPCRRLPIVVGNLLTNSFEQIFLGSSLMRQFRRFSSNFIECGKCEYSAICRGCPAVTYGLTQNPFEKYPYCILSTQEKELHLAKKENSILVAEPRPDCSNEEEMKYILNSMSNKIANHPLEFLRRKEFIKVFNQLNSTKEEKRRFFYEYQGWNRKDEEALGIDERYFLAHLLYEDEENDN